MTQRHTAQARFAMSDEAFAEAELEQNNDIHQPEHKVGDTVILWNAYGKLLMQRGIVAAVKYRVKKSTEAAGHRECAWHYQIFRWPFLFSHKENQRIKEKNELMRASVDDDDTWFEQDAVDTAEEEDGWVPTEKMVALLTRNLLYHATPPSSDPPTAEGEEN